MFLCVYFLFSCLEKKKGESGRSYALQSQMHSSATRASQLFPLFSQKSQPASTGAQMNDCCLLCRIISQEMCVHRRLRRLCFTPLSSTCSSLCFSSGKQNAVGREGKRQSAKSDERLDDDKHEGSDIVAP